METTLREYLDELEKRYQAHYNVETYKEIAGKQIDIYAISIIEHFRHILSKKIQIDHYQEREIILVKGFNQFIQAEEIKEFSQYLVTISKELITPSFEVMSHTINGIMVSSQGFSKEAIETAWLALMKKGKHLLMPWPNTIIKSINILYKNKSNKII